jgi:hypothetical protein
MEELITTDEAARRLCLAPSSLIDPRFRARLELPCVRVGRKIAFATADIDALITRRKEVLTAHEERKEHDNICMQCHRAAPDVGCQRHDADPGLAAILAIHRRGRARPSGE